MSTNRASWTSWLTQQHLVCLQFEVESLQSDVKELKKAAFSKEAFEENNSLVIFYTGLSNWEIFSVLYDYVKSDLSSCLSVTCDPHEAKTKLKHPRSWISFQSSSQHNIPNLSSDY
jgi:hypothetical protein